MEIVFWILVIVLFFIGGVIILISNVEKSDRMRISERALTQGRNALKEYEIRERIKRYPIKKLVQEEFNKIPNAGSLPDGFWKDCSIGFWFVCLPSILVPNTIVIGQVVSGGDLIAEQWGAGLSIPNRGFNRYRVKIVG